LPIFYCMNVSVLLIQPPGCHNPINVMLGSAPTEMSWLYNSANG